MAARTPHRRHNARQNQYLLSLTNDRIIEHSRRGTSSFGSRRRWRTGAFRMCGRASVEDELWLTAREAADLTDVSVVTVYSWVR